jgi:hypothetical protein
MKIARRRVGSMPSKLRRIPEHGLFARVLANADREHLRRASPQLGANTGNPRGARQLMLPNRYHGYRLPS